MRSTDERVLVLELASDGLLLDWSGGGAMVQPRMAGLRLGQGVGSNLYTDKSRTGKKR
jgi:hypothetical protein